MSNIGNKETLANNLKFYVNKSNKSRAEICKDLNFAYSTFTEWINGRKYPRIDKIELLANYFGIEKSDLIEERDKIDKTIGLKAKLLREARHITRVELSQELGISVDELSWYEEGWREIPPEVLEAISKYFDIDVKELSGSKVTPNTVFVSENPRQIELHKKWFDAVGVIDWTDEELTELINYANYIISKRK